MKYTVIYEKGPSSWGAYVPDLPGMIAVADSREDAERLIREAVELHLEGLRDEGCPIPDPSSHAGEVEVDRAAWLQRRAPRARSLLSMNVRWLGARVDDWMAAR